MSKPVHDYTDLSRMQLYTSFALVTSLFFLWGFSYGLLDVLNQHFLTVFQLKSKTETTMLQFAYFISYLIVAPPMGLFMRKYGYKLGIHVGLGIFATGAVLFWPSAKYRQYGMFVAFTFVAGSGLATLEVAANTYITLLGPPRYAALRLTLAQGFNGIATVIGPIIASHAFFKGENATQLGTVQYVYLAMACFATLLNIILIFIKLPEVRQAVTDEDLEKLKSGGWKGFFKMHHTTWGIFAEFCYVGGQVAVAATAIFYFVHQPGLNPPISASLASNLFAACQATFTAGRFIAVIYLRWIDPAFSLFVHGFMLVLFSILTATIDGAGGIACLFVVFLFESHCYPVIFALASSNLGPYTVIGGALTAAGVSGGAWYPAAQAALADRATTQISYLVAMTGFIPLMIYGGVMWLHRCHKHGKYSIWVKDLEGADAEHIETDLRRHSMARQMSVDTHGEGKRENSFLEHEVNTTPKMRGTVGNL
ncbi:hypothetical protein CcaverHIS002_0104230 [Cutaneotrichosporon cavernicola]|uniref:MFS general substrate transporter n=1 Tax=Cutaneotrichosporon cavernicola TaxID=279322 RepID=A0AA48L1Y2_9TREE|nr:uncharacterized protein CcaverHIS019_0104160 [Cutaneotrichosporon cavernicola]BEI79894.1 hypothetical protein CcaverHIS002_0104230 [Cutaneotrichosporon cavernicola]BEI87698.1 hypothetical protein CcaverHIS019_0104160 [Cutaneotrichosporon cavernicola]BEI95470.1 hypothetical protein CcaverHIS631_0104190 [Cutaneotrichosporon cavernicola]BEJ03244.1 hypothetical protein CcaverHIS641_0104190 [Cutaneotrichosporon cavernicola]